MKIKIITTGGTIDKIYFDKLSDFKVGDPQIGEVLKEAGVTVPFEVTSLMKKDSLDLTAADRKLIYTHIKNDPGSHFLITHGTDTIVETAKILQRLEAKVIVLTGSMAPAKFRISDAIFNIGFAVGALQGLSNGVYVTMNGRIYKPDSLKKNRDGGFFEEA